MQDSPYLGMAEQLEDSAAAVALHNKQHPDNPVTIDTVRSPAGAVGRYQVMPSTARLYGLDPNRLTDPAYNRLASNLILQDLHKQFGDDRGAIAVAYNAGPAAAERWLKAGKDFSVLPEETRGYLRRATDPWAPDWTAPTPTFAAKATPPKPGADEWGVAQPPPAPVGKPESSWAEVLSPNFASAWDRFKNAGLGLAQWMYNQDPTQQRFLGVSVPGTGTPLPPELQKRIDAYRAPVNRWLNKARADVATDIKTNAPQLNEGSAKQITYQTLAGVTDMVPALAAGFLTKNPAVAATVMGAQAGGARYSQAIEEGRTPAQASMDAQFDAMVNGGLGLLPMHALMAPGGSFLKKTLTNAGAFGVQSVATEALQIGYDKGIIGKDMTLKQAWDRVEQAGIVGTLTGAFLGGGHTAMERAVSRLHAGAPEAPQERVEPGAAPQGPPEAGAPGAPTAAPTSADLMAKIGLEKAGTAPAPVDPWAPVTSVSRETTSETPEPTSESGFTTTPMNIRAEHEALMSQLAAEGTEAAKRKLPQTPLPSTEAPALPAPQAASVASEGIPRRELEPDTAVTANGREVPVRYAVVEAAHLVPSQTPEGHPNPNFPAELQPRDRTRAVSQAQIASIAQNINPRLLDRSPNASDGAPIVAPSGVVESGNGRSLALQRAYAEGLPSAQAYRDYLEQAGYPVEGMTAPVLVRVREGEMSPQDRQAFVREANQSGQLGYSATERAMADAAAIPDSSLDLYRGGDVESAANRDFVRAFMRAAVPSNEHAGMIDAHGALSQDAVRRVRAALLAKAYSDPDLVGSIVESQDSNTKAIGGALTDAAADWAKMRGMAANGEISPALDQTGKLLEAVKLIDHARATGRNVAEFVSQPDIFSGEAIDPDVEAWLRLMFRNTKDWTQPVGRDKLAAALQFYAREAQKARAEQFLIGAPLSGADILQTAKARQYGERAAETGPSLSFGQTLRPFGRGGAGPGAESPASRGGDGFAEGRAKAAATHLTPAAHVIEGKFGPRPYDADLTEPNPGFEKDLGPELDKFVKDSGVDARTQPDRALQAIANYVFMRGHKFGFESLGIRGDDGRLYATTDGLKSSVMFKGPTLRAMNDPSQRLVTFHNHPSSMGFSGGDTASLAYAGHAAMVVITHDGNFHTMTLKARLATDRMKAADELARLHRMAFTEAGRHMDPLFRDGTANEDDANYMSSQIIHGILERAGIIDYMGSRTVPAHLALGMEDAIERGAALVRSSAINNGLVTPGPAPRAYRLPRSVQFDQAMADLLGGARENAVQPGGAGREAESAPAPRQPTYTKPRQLQLLENGLHEDEKSPEFKAWFGDSVVKGEDGKPLVVYHGTPSGRAIGTFRTPAYFTNEPSFAEMFAQERGEKRGAIYPAFLKIEHPYVIDATKEGRHFEWDRQDVARMKAEGYDGVIVKGGEDESDIYTPFDPAQIKSAIGNRGTFNPNDPNILREDERRYENEQERTRAPFYSGLTRAIEDSKLIRAPAKDWSGLIDNLRNKGVKQEEIEWSGVRDWLAKQTGPVTKDQVLEHLRENEVRVQEVEKGESDYANLDKQWNDAADAVNAGAREGLPPSEMNRLRDIRDDLRDRRDAAAREATNTKFGEYTLPGGENYRELLLTLPEFIDKATLREVEVQKQMRALEGQKARGEISKAEFESRFSPLAEEQDRLAFEQRPFMHGFRSSHFDEPNILAHIRFDDRTGPNGEKILHMAEVQSDWHQKGRKEGYQPADAGKLHQQATEERDALRPAVDEMLKRNGYLGYDAPVGARMAIAREPKSFDYDTPEDAALAEKYSAAMAKLESTTQAAKNAVPNAPFKTSWHELALKRMLRYAAEHGYDKLSWDTGDTSADRYDLSKQVDRVTYAPDTKHLHAWKDGKLIIRQTVEPAKLPDVIGKDAADKLMKSEITPDSSFHKDAPGREHVHAIEGDDLKVGGAGMKGFYDKILPAAANKLGKKFGAKVERGNLENKQIASGEAIMDRLGIPAAEQREYWKNLEPEERDRLFDDFWKQGVPIHSIAITPDMRASVMQGQPLFEEGKRYAEEPGAVDAHGKPLPQTIIPGGEQSAAQLAKAREAAGHGLKVTKAKQKEPGGLFGGGENSDLGQGSLFEDGRRYTVEEDNGRFYVVHDGSYISSHTTREAADRVVDHLESRAQAPAPTLPRQGSLFEDEKRYRELPAGDREMLERAARTGNWIGKFGANGDTPIEKIRSAIEGAYESWRDNPSVVPPAIGAVFKKAGGLPAGFSDLPTTRPGETFTENVKKRAAGALDIVRDVQMLLAPMSQGSKEARAVVKDFANLGRLARYHGQRMMEGLKKNFDHNQLRRMWIAADEESVARQKGESTAGIGLATLTPEERRAVQEQQADAQNVWNAAKDVGIVKGEGLPSYAPRMMVEVASAGVQGLGHGEGARSIPGIGRNLRTSTGQTKHRKYLTTEETEAAGGKKFGTVANVVRDIRTLPLATMRLREAVAGRALINQIKEIGAHTGQETVVEGHEPAGTPYKWFTLDHPSFKTWRPKFITDPESGKIVAQKDQNGETVFEKVPIFVRDDFEGPLRAALSQDTGKAYNGLMNLKGRAMQAIMYSPLIHNAVEWGRAIPAMPGKVATFKIYFEGNAAKRDPEVMTQAIMHGLVPIGHNFGIQDVTSLANPDSIKAGRSWTAKAVGAIPGLFSRDAQQRVYRTIDRMGDVWHNTLLWDRVGDLQMGLYTNLRDHAVKKGMDPDSAQYVAAHFANRYAGALPLEAMSSMSRKIANLLLFSRTYTLGNLGAMKDVVTGLPRDVQAQIERTAGEAGLSKIKSMARRKALTILATDIALFYVGNSLLQSGVAYMTGRQDLSDIELGYAKRLGMLLQKGTQNPLALLNPFQDLQDLSATSENEPGRENRVLVGFDHNGTAIYARNPVGKIGEEFTDWLSSPIQTLKKKLGTFARPTYEALTNDAGFGRHVYDPNAHGAAAVAKDVGKIIQLYIGSQVPLDSLKSAANLLMENDKQNKEIDVYKTLGPLVGVTFSKGAPGGPAVGAMYSLREQHDAAVQEAMPDIQLQIRNGDILGARKAMHALKIPPGLQNYYIRAARNPRIRLNTKSARELIRNASPEDRARINELRKANQP